MRHLSNVQRVAVLTLAAAMSLQAASAFAQTPTFVRSDSPLATNDLIAADLNGDGRPDLAGLAAAGAAVLLGNGDGTFQPIATYPVFSWSQQGIGVVRDGYVDHAERLERPRRDLVRCVLERREQEKDVHVHADRQRVGDGQCAIARRDI